MIQIKPTSGLSSRWLLLTLSLLLPLAVYGASPFRLGIVAGTNMSSHSKHPTTDTKWGIQFGFKGLMELNEHFYLEAHALFSQKGYDAPIVLNEEYKRKMYTLEFPLHLGYKYELAPSGITLFVSGGPYLGLGLAGKSKFYMEDGTLITKNLYKSGSGDQRFDLGAGLKAGIQLGDHTQFTLGYDWGFIKVNKHLAGSRNQNLHLALAYLF